jgi:hypothetical protein
VHGVQAVHSGRGFLGEALDVIIWIGRLGFLVKAA